VVSQSAHVESAVLVVPQLATPAVWAARLGAWDVLRIPEARPSRLTPRGSLWLSATSLCGIVVHFAPLNLQATK
jgi:hypothetical protein